MNGLTVDDCRLIIESLDWSVRKFEEYEQYPSYDFKLQRVREVKDVRQKLRNLRDELKGATDAH